MEMMNGDKLYGEGIIIIIIMEVQVKKNIIYMEAKV